jgi:hypothetical protein
VRAEDLTVLFVGVAESSLGDEVLNGVGPRPVDADRAGGADRE